MPIRIDRGSGSEEITLNGRSFKLNTVIGEQHQKFIEVGGKQLVGDYWELEKGVHDRENPAFVFVDGRWIEGHTHEQRLTGLSHPERQKIFTSNDGSLTFVASSSRITV
jgi:hypothetical protein